MAFVAFDAAIGAGTGLAGMWGVIPARIYELEAALLEVVLEALPVATLAITSLAKFVVILVVVLVLVAVDETLLAIEVFSVVNEVVFDVKLAVSESAESLPA